MVFSNGRSLFQWHLPKDFHFPCGLSLESSVAVSNGCSLLGAPVCSLPPREPLRQHRHARRDTVEGRAHAGQEVTHYALAIDLLDLLPREVAVHGLRGGAPQERAAGGDLLLRGRLQPDVELEALAVPGLDLLRGAQAAELAVDLSTTISRLSPCSSVCSIEHRETYNKQHV